ncbi:uncharacterized protein [Physcomitrium patens]|uniref:uncharacterized protein n=1 Tax=Physcomitrium patens TaxID=3218 RepID=UPI003CCCB6EA
MLEPSRSSGHRYCDAFSSACTWPRTHAPPHMHQFLDAAHPHSNPGEQHKILKVAYYSSPNATSSDRQIPHPPTSTNPPFVLLSDVPGFRSTSWNPQNLRRG